MERRRKQDAVTPQRGDTAPAARLPGHRVTLSPMGSVRVRAKGPGTRNGFTLIELVVSLSVLTILTLGVIPLVKLSVKRQKEQQLRETLRAVRSAIDEFHRDTIGLNCTGGPVVTAPPDPRSRVMVSDCTIFGVDNPDRYPPDLQTLVDGVNVLPRVPIITGGGPLSQSATKKKVYLRNLPIDPLTGENEWDYRSCYDAPDTDSWGGENLFDIRSKSRGTALNGEKYSDW